MRIFELYFLSFINCAIDINFDCQENGMVISLRSETEDLGLIAEKSYVDNFRESKFNEACRFAGENRRFFAYAHCAKEIDGEFQSQGNSKIILRLIINFILTQT